MHNLLSINVLKIHNSNLRDTVFQVRDAEYRALGRVAEALDFPAVRENDLRHDGQAEARAFLVRREIGLEDFLPIFGRDAGAVVADFQRGVGGVLALGDNLDCPPSSTA